MGVHWDHLAGAILMNTHSVFLWRNCGSFPFNLGNEENVALVLL